ncbi:hypothetical protein OJ252_3711 [Cryptosporidium canis]|uniref:Uncharacterized protein n=1 Tax=Cryptosporidium canis TaxID=195482 RepID=A0ABQ8P3Z7_9CRYT|nr:hypothetical protein OJ252_3711 [Cryptosporidium canis]
MSILISENINEIKNIYEPESENELMNKNYNIVSINKRRKTACEREAIFNRLVLNNPSIISIDKTLLPGTCVYCNICQVRIILNPAYYLNNWRTHMNGKLHKALSKAVGSPQFLDELDFCLEKEEDSYFESLNVLGYNSNMNNISITNGRNDYNIAVSTHNFVNSQLINQNENFNISNSSERFDLLIKSPRLLSCNTNSIKMNNELIINNLNLKGSSQCESSNYENKVMEILDEESGGDGHLDNLREMNNINNMDSELVITNRIQETRNTIQRQDYVMHPIISNLGIDKNRIGDEFSFVLGDDLYKSALYEQNSLITNDNNDMSNSEVQEREAISSVDEKLMGGNYLHASQGDIDNKNLISNQVDIGLDKNANSNTVAKHYSSTSKKCIQERNQAEDTPGNLMEENAGKLQNNISSEGNCIDSNTSYSKVELPVVSPLIRLNFEQIGTFHCPGINKVRYWAMCFIGSERSSEPENELCNYNDTRRVFYKQSVITKISPNHEPEHQGVVHHPNCLEIVSKPNEPCERCSLYVNNRQLARVISKRATRLQEMWDRVVAGESILNGGKIPQSIISAYNHRIDHWSRCNDPLEAITRALAGCRQRDYTNFFWKIRENLLKNSRLIRNQL